MTITGNTTCSTCNLPKDIYGVPWCPRCDKPQLKNVQTLNLFQALSHLEAIGYTGIKDRFWDAFCGYSKINNDSYFDLTFPEDEDIEDISVNHYMDLMALKREFKLGESILLEVYW